MQQQNALYRMLLILSVWCVMC